MMTVKHLIDILQDFNKEAEVKLWWDSVPRGDVEAIYDTCDKKTVVLAGKWGHCRIEHGAESGNLECVQSELDVILTHP